MEIPTTEWTALGPFPSGMREDLLMASPLHAFKIPDANATSDASTVSDLDADADADVRFAFAPYNTLHPPTALLAGGAQWQHLTAGSDGRLAITFPADWAALRAEHGWAGNQFRAELRARITIPDEGTVNVRVDAPAIAEYAFVRAGDKAVTWFSGDVYEFSETPDGRRGLEGGKDVGPSNFARSVALRAGEYVLLARALYEVRMFGDPGVHPTIRGGVRVFLDTAAQHDPSAVVLEHGVDVVPDVREGYLLGQWLSVGIRVPPGSGGGKGFVDVALLGGAPGVQVSGFGRVHAGQKRALPLKIAQTAPLPDSQEVLYLTLTTGNQKVDIQLPLRRSKAAASFTFASPEGADPPALVSRATLIPPSDSPDVTPDTTSVTDKEKELPPVLLALHGAGVDAAADFWIDAIPRIPRTWAILPTGRNEWAEDWHGGSAADVWAARNALPTVLAPLGLEVSAETVLIGHSNGGQGAWHAAARYPDRIRGVVAAAGWLTIQDYVPYTCLNARHYADPALLGVLNASLAPFNNDLYASNLASVPVLALHGSADNNVPARHSRAHIAILNSWLHAETPKEVSYTEVPGEGHWWDGILRDPAVLAFLRDLPPRKSMDDVRNAGFTLTTANPDESGSKGGIRIVELAVPGRLARLDVNAPQWKRGDGEGLSLHSTNIRRIEVTGWAQGATGTDADADAEAQVLVREDGQWRPDTRPRPIPPVRAYGPMIRLLATEGTITLVVPDQTEGGGSPSASSAALLGLALQYADDLRTYHRIDVVIATATEALHAVAEDALPGNIVAYGRPEENRFVDWLVRQERTPVRFPTKGIFSVDGRIVWERGSGIITLHPHPTRPRGLLALVAGNDAAGLAAAARLLPLRTGVPVPDWAVVTARCAWQGAGGFAGAGFWSGEWGWSSAMCWMDRE